MKLSSYDQFILNDHSQTNEKKMPEIIAFQTVIKVPYYMFAKRNLTQSDITKVLAQQRLRFHFFS